MVNFDQPSYSVMEDDAAVVVGIALSQSSSMDIVVEVDTMDVTATGNSRNFARIINHFLASQK